MQVSHPFVKAPCSVLSHASKGALSDRYAHAAKEVISLLRAKISPTYTSASKSKPEASKIIRLHSSGHVFMAHILLLARAFLCVMETQNTLNSGARNASAVICTRTAIKKFRIRVPGPSDRIHIHAPATVSMCADACTRRRA